MYLKNKMLKIYKKLEGVYTDLHPGPPRRFITCFVILKAVQHKRPSAFICLISCLSQVKKQTKKVAKDRKDIWNWTRQQNKSILLFFHFCNNDGRHDHMNCHDVDLIRWEESWKQVKPGSVAFLLFFWLWKFWNFQVSSFLEPSEGFLSEKMLNYWRHYRRMLSSTFVVFQSCHPVIWSMFAVGRGLPIQPLLFSVCVPAALSPTKRQEVLCILFLYNWRK